MELTEVYHEAMGTWIIARVTSGKCEGAEFVFGLIESAIRKEATEILLTPVQELDMVRMDFGRPHCYYRQPDITRAQFAYLAICLVLIGNVAAEEARIGSRSIATARWRTLSSVVGIPIGRVSFPSPFGMRTRFTGGAQ